MGNWLINHWFSAAVLAAWLGINIFLFTYYFLFFDQDDRYFYTRAILGVRCSLQHPACPRALLAGLQQGRGCSTPEPFLVLPSSSSPPLHPSPCLGLCSYPSITPYQYPSHSPSPDCSVPAQHHLAPSHPGALSLQEAAPCPWHSGTHPIPVSISPVSLGVGPGISQVPQLQQHADPAACLPQPALLPARELLGECPRAAPQLGCPRPCSRLRPNPATSPCSAAGGPCASSSTTTSPSTSWWPTRWPCSQVAAPCCSAHVPPEPCGVTAGDRLFPCTAVHTIAHLFNLERYNHSQQANDGSLHAVLSKMHLQDSNKWLNPIHSNQTTVEYVAFTTIPGLTGVIITLALILMVTSSTEFIRRNYFEVFWYTHHLFIIYFIGLVIHGVAGLVRGQTEESMEEVHPQRCAEFLVQKPKECKEECCKEPEFGSIPAESWKWVLAPVILYIFERILRIWRARQKVVVTKVVMHPAKVLELQMQKKGFRMEVGQYIFVNCPAVSLLEWHPFTLTSAPEEDFFSIHIRVAGDWTERIIDTFQQQKLEMPRIKVDGPFGTASEDVFLYEVAMLVGAGIGVTPFASILKSIWYRFQQNDQTLKTKKIYFYWLCRDTGAFTWFNDLLASLEQKMAESGKADFLTYRLFLTGWDTSIADNAALHFDTVTDTVTGLRQKTIFGRPRWDTEFSVVATAHPRSVVGVFLCGPEALAKVLQRSCHQHSSLDPRKVKFYFNKENF
ncbi:NADPH oxidase 1 isoform X2 [Numida meleagris]|uniref:NADPH oxidase 1 isoform X2 n=1 Tax=Numida meleagris TaxID=8996 RepID=UPI000B3DBE18|nr:NADPH oxidase 1 isoform X2 [Numida meleagris]